MARSEPSAPSDLAAVSITTAVFDAVKGVLTVSEATTFPLIKPSARRVPAAKAGTEKVNGGCATSAKTSGDCVLTSVSLRYSDTCWQLLNIRTESGETAVQKLAIRTMGPE